MFWKRLPTLFDDYSVDGPSQTGALCTLIVAEFVPRGIVPTHFHWGGKGTVSPKGWFWRMCPQFPVSVPGEHANVPSGSRFSFLGGTSECTLVPVFVPREHPPKPPFWETTLLRHLAVPEKFVAMIYGLFPFPDSDCREFSTLWASTASDLGREPRKNRSHLMARSRRRRTGEP